MQKTIDNTLDLRITGAATALAAALSVIAMGHHPTGAADVALANIVHATMIAISVTLLAGFSRFALWRGIARFPVVFGLVAYGFSAVSNILAATMSGFIVPAIAGRELTEGLMAFAWAFNQSFAFAAVYAIGAAFAGWGIDLVLRGKSIDRGLGVFGIIAGVGPAIGLATGVIDLHVAGAFKIYAVHSLFAIAIGMRLFTAKE